MAHRYLYYVRNTPIISDQEYDRLERQVVDTVGEDHPLRQPGSDREESYSAAVKALASRLLDAATKG